MPKKLYIHKSLHTFFSLEGGGALPLGGTLSLPHLLKPGDGDELGTAGGAELDMIGGGAFPEKELEA